MIKRSLVILFFAIVFNTANAESLLPNKVKNMSLGSSTCASSLCHGSISTWKDAVVLQNEYTTWMKLDSHSKAYEVLLNKDSIKIAKNLGLKEPAHKADVCLDCHAHNVPLKLRGEKFDISEGVSCEGCHGGAEHFISSHTIRNKTLSDNVKRGL